MYTVEISWTANKAPTEDQLFELTAHHGAAVSVGPEPTRLHATLTVDPDGTAEPLEDIDIGQPAGFAVDYVTGIAPGTVHAVEVMTTDEQDRRLALPAFPDLVGVSEIADLLGVNRQRASALQTRHDFPAPVAVLRAGPIWRRRDIATFEATWERKPGRPRKVVT